MKPDHLRLFPCCVCGEAREVGMTKKGKPYLICDPCGVQVVVRGKTGIRRFEELVADAAGNNVWKRLAELQQRYQFECPKCRKKFWLTPELIKTNWANGKLEGYHLRPAAVKAGVLAKDDKVRFGFHNLRHSLADNMTLKSTCFRELPICWLYYLCKPLVFANCGWKKNAEAL